jgi:CRP-like cAMP-binding protein
MPRGCSPPRPRIYPTHTPVDTRIGKPLAAYLVVCAAKRFTFANELLDSIPGHEMDLLRPYLETEILKKESVLIEAGAEPERLYFPNGGLISCIVSTSVGEQMEIYPAGSRDVVGLIQNPEQSWRAKVLIAGDAVTLQRQVLVRLLPQMEEFRDALLGYLAGLTAFVGQRVCCAHFHTPIERVCLWLALASEISKTCDLECTQQSIADAIGVRRATVTVALGGLQRQGIVRCQRGHVYILDQTRLYEEACGCLPMFLTEQTRLTATLR